PCQMGVRTDLLLIGHIALDKTAWHDAGGTPGWLIRLVAMARPAQANQRTPPGSSFGFIRWFS
ncbi:hypothetical protein, partial [Weissella cibaria]|uniref:hypothetical protein n=1 Tax=Weissella cibaria TaxID=137591 RepID=UPI0019D678BF